MPELTFSDSIFIARTPQEVYDLVSDVTRTGEWSPICKACWWDDGAGPTVGSWFTGRNETPDRTWETRSLVIAADPGREFAWHVGDGSGEARVYWSYTMVHADGGSLLTESWEFLPAGIAFFQKRDGEEAPRQIAARTAAARSGIPVTLAAIKRIAEAT